MRLTHPWPALIVALVATNVVTAAALVLWSDARLAEQARWAANREKTRDMFGLVIDLAGTAEWLERAANTSLSARDRGDAVANATGPASSLIGHAESLVADYGDANETVRALWSDTSTLGRFRQFFQEFARSFYLNGTTSAAEGRVVDNITRIARGLQSLLYPIAPDFDGAAPVASFPLDPMARLSVAEFAAVRGLARQAACAYFGYSGGDIPQQCA